MLEDLERIRDEHETTYVLVKRTGNEYADKMVEAKRQLERRIDELEGVVSDPGLVNGTRGREKGRAKEKVRIGPRSAAVPTRCGSGLLC